MSTKREIFCLLSSVFYLYIKSIIEIEIELTEQYLAQLILIKKRNHSYNNFIYIYIFKVSGNVLKFLNKFKHNYTRRTSIHQNHIYRGGKNLKKENHTQEFSSRIFKPKKTRWNNTISKLTNPDTQRVTQIINSKESHSRVSRKKFKNRITRSYFPTNRRKIKNSTNET